MCQVVNLQLSTGKKMNMATIGALQAHISRRDTDSVQRIQEAKARYIHNQVSNSIPASYILDHSHIQLAWNYLKSTNPGYVSR
jgi:hypothetical protein